MRPAGILLICVFAAVLYGVLHDQITARICVEYFTVGHPPVFPIDDPTLLGLGWGIIATWWVGLILGIGLVIGARVGRREPRSLRSLVKPIGQLLLVMAGCAALCGLIGYVAGREKWVELDGSLGRDIPESKHAAFLACWFAHSASYLVGFVGGFVVIVRLWWNRPTRVIRRANQ
jgi:hypothetical protein